MDLSLVQEEYAASTCVAVDGAGYPAGWCTRHDKETVEGKAFCGEGAERAIVRRPVPVLAEGLTQSMVEACARAEYEGTSAAEFCEWKRLPEVARERRREAATRGLNAVEALR